jgi:DNA-binding MarR family transcriptional regulator
MGTDPIDWMLRHWDEEELGEPRTFLAAASLMRLYQLLTAEMDRELKRLDLSRQGYLLLMTLLVTPDGRRLMSRLSSHLMVHPTTVTLTVDQLEKQGWVKRELHPSDRRATYAHITPRGRTVAKKATRALRDINFGLPGVEVADAVRLMQLLGTIREAAGDVDRLNAGSLGSSAK